MIRRSTNRASRLTAPRSLRLEVCEERRLTAADLGLASPLVATQVVAPAAPSNGIIAILIGLHSSPTTTSPDAQSVTGGPTSAISVDIWEHAVRSEPDFDFLR